MQWDISSTFGCSCFMFTDSLLACISVHNLLAWCPRRLGEDIGSLGSAFIDGCEATYEYREANSGPPEEQPAPLHFKTAIPSSSNSETNEDLCSFWLFIFFLSFSESLYMFSYTVSYLSLAFTDDLNSSVVVSWIFISCGGNCPVCKQCLGPPFFTFRA